jgi:hypothetical protein
VANETSPEDKSPKEDNVAPRDFPEYLKGKSRMEKYNQKSALVGRKTGGKSFQRGSMPINRLKSMKKANSIFHKNSSIANLTEIVTIKPPPYTGLVSPIQDSLDHIKNLVPKNTPVEHMNLDNLSNLLSAIQNEVSAIEQNRAENLENHQDLQHAKDLAKEGGDAK